MSSPFFIKNSIVKPFSSLLYALIHPLCILIISFAIDKPKPLIFLDLSVVNNGLNILFKFSLSTPLPLSITLNVLIMV